MLIFKHTHAQNRLNDWLKQTLGLLSELCLFPYRRFASLHFNSPSLFKQQPFWMEQCTPGGLQKANTACPGSNFPRQTIKLSQQKENSLYGGLCKMPFVRTGEYQLASGTSLILRGITAKCLGASSEQPALRYHFKHGSVSSQWMG